MDRQVIFRNNYERLMLKVEEVQRGQRLFGLPEMNLVSLKGVYKQLEMLQRLHSLYNDVHNVVNGFRETPWREANFQEIEYQLLTLQTRCSILLNIYLMLFKYKQKIRPPCLNRVDWPTYMLGIRLVH